MKKQSFGAVGTAIVLALGAVTFALAPDAYADEREVATPVEPTLAWLSDLDEALAQSKKSGKPILLEFR